MDPLLAFAAIKSAHASIMSAIKIGKDISSLSAAAAKYGKAEAALQSHSEAKKKGLLAKLGVLESNAIDNYFKKAEQDELRDELRSAFLLYAKPGAWESLQSEKDTRPLPCFWYLRFVCHSPGNVWFCVCKKHRGSNLHDFIEGHVREYC